MRTSPSSCRPRGAGLSTKRGGAWRVVGCVVLGVSAAPGHAEAQRVWHVAHEPQVSLWYHGLAVLGLNGASRLYDGTYARRIRDEKERLGIYPTPLDRERSALRSALSDPAFEVLHFLPLYFVGSSRDAMSDAVRAAAGRIPTARVAPRARTGAQVVAEVLPTQEQRDALVRLADVLASEWNAFYGTYWQTQASARDAQTAQASTVWLTVQDKLAAYLRSRGLTSGVLVVSDALGPEGRILDGDPGNADDNVMAVAARDGDAPGAIVSRAIREVCFPVVRVAVDAWGGAPADPRRASELSTRAAVRCGDLLLVRGAGELVSSYRNTALADWGLGADGESGVRFEQAFPVPQELLDLMGLRLGGTTQAR